MKVAEAHADARTKHYCGEQAVDIFPLGEDKEQAVGFEVDSIYLSRKSLAEILRRTEGVTDVLLRGRFGSSDDVRVEFKYRGQGYLVWEPFGDNSRYWIGPKNGNDSLPDMTALEESFRNYSPPFYLRLLGDLVTFRMFRRRFGRR